MTTINQEEIQKFSKLADEWWNANGKFKPLHAFNPVRIKYIIDKCKSHFKLKRKDEKPLSEKKEINEKFDVILNLEVVEHVENLDLFLKSSSDLLKKNGIMFIATINRTFESYIKAIVGAEYLLRWLPIGTHSWEKFLKPNEIEHRLNKLNLRKFNLDGLRFNIMSNSWNLSENCSVNYIMVAKKN